MKRLFKLYRKLIGLFALMVGFIAGLIAIQGYLIKAEKSHFIVKEPFEFKFSIVLAVIISFIAVLLFILPYFIIFSRRLHEQTFKLSFYKLRGKFFLHSRFKKIVEEIANNIVEEVRSSKELEGNSFGQLENELSIYQFGSSSPKRKEYHNTTSNINLLVTTDNFNGNIILQNLNKIQRSLSKNRKLSTLNIRFYTSYQEDKHSASNVNDLKIFLLVRPRNYLEEKSLSQPLFILNIINDGECLFGSNQIENLDPDKIKMTISYDNLYRGTGGIIELKTFLSDSAFHIGNNDVAFLRSLKYVVLRAFQIFILFKDNILVSLNSELFKKFKQDEYSRLYADRTTAQHIIKALTPFFEGDFYEKNKKLKVKELRAIHHAAYNFVLNIEEQMDLINTSRKNPYVGFGSRTEMEAKIKVVEKELVDVLKKFDVRIITHALDDIVLAEYVNNLLKEKGVETSLFVYESPELLKRFNVADFDHQFRFYNDFDVSIDNTLIFYVGSGTVIGKLLEVTLESFYSKFYESSKSGIDWGCLLINVNPNDEDRTVWKDCFNKLKNNLVFLNYPKIELLITGDGTRI